tara:strand:- start:3979 stop:4821 length:843 start_codon:yes stop_codon:yes gene_type:complete
MATPLTKTLTTAVTGFEGIGSVINTNAADPLQHEPTRDLKTLTLADSKADYIHLFVKTSEINGLLGNFVPNSTTDGADDGDWENVNISLQPNFLGAPAKCAVLADNYKPIESQLDTFKLNIGTFLTGAQEAIFSMVNFQNTVISTTTFQGLINSASGAGFTIEDVNKQLRKAIDEGISSRNHSSKMSDGFKDNDDILIEGIDPSVGVTQQGLQIKFSLAQLADPDGTNSPTDENVLDFNSIITTAPTQSNSVPTLDGSSVNFNISPLNTVRITVKDILPS